MSERPGVYGAKRQSWYEKNPRELLHRVMRENPRGSEKEVFEGFCDHVENDPGYWGAIIEYWFANNYRLFYVSEIAANSVAISRRETKQRARDVVAREKAIIKDRLRAALMDLVLSNGKKLREATFGDCEREGGWLLAISKRGKRGEIVGKKLTEDDLHNIQRRFAEAA